MRNHQSGMSALTTVASFFSRLQRAETSLSGPMEDEVQFNNLVEFLRLGCPKIISSEPGKTSTPRNYQLARNILGDDFISPVQTVEAHGYTYTRDQLANFIASMPSKAELIWLRDNNYMLVAGPPVSLNLREIASVNIHLFTKREDPWFIQRPFGFSHHDMIRGGRWLKLRKDEAPDTKSKDSNDQFRLLSEIEYVPNAAEVCYGLVTFSKVRGVRLFGDIRVRSSSIYDHSHMVRIGPFTENGIVIDHHPSEDTCSNTAAPAARN